MAADLQARTEWFAQHVLVGRVHGLFGIQGWIKLYSHTAPPDNIFSYRRWHLRGDGVDAPFTLAAGRRQGKGLVAQLVPEQGAAISSRDAATVLLGADIYVARADLPALAEGDYYQADLLELTVVTLAGEPLGRVAGFIETGAHPVMSVRNGREHLIPFIRDHYVMDVDLAAGRITVDWAPDFI